MGQVKKNSSLTKILWAFIIIGFAIIEFPGIYFINRLDPFIFKLPFIYGFTIIMWMFMCIVTFVGYKTNWGRGKDFVEGINDIEEVKGGSHR